MKTTNNTCKKRPTVKIVGAGPGDLELLTLKAYKAIKTAKVILYDALIGEEILNIASSSAKLVYVGKRAANHSYSQEEINQLIVNYAFNYGEVVRLKGGDPYIFGRGQEEYDYVSAFGIEVEVVPGISSALSVPALSNIPLTKRGVSESFWVLTATDKNGELSQGINCAVKSSATIVVLMGLKKLAQIVQLFQENNKGELPIAILQNGSLSSNHSIIGTIDSIVVQANNNLVDGPGIIVIGEVVATSFQNKLEGIGNEFNILKEKL